MRQRLFTCMNYFGHLVVERCTESAPSDENRGDLTAYLPKRQSLSKSFSNAHRNTRIFATIRHLEIRDHRIIARRSVAARSKGVGLWPLACWDCAFEFHRGAWMYVCCECCVLSGRGLCDELITRPEESYRLWCVLVCDLETSWIRKPCPTGGCRSRRRRRRRRRRREGEEEGGGGEEEEEEEEEEEDNRSRSGTCSVYWLCWQLKVVTREYLREWLTYIWVEGTADLVPVLTMKGKGGSKH